MQQKTPKKHEVKSFLLAFGAAFLVLAVIATAVVMIVGRKNGLIQEEISKPQVEDSYIPSDEDDLTLLLSFHEDPSAEDSPASYHLLHFDAATARTLVIPLPYQTALDTSQGTDTLDGIWKEGRGEMAAAAVGEHLQVPVDAYMDMDLAGLEEFISRCGTVKYEIAQSASFTRGERKVSLSQGKQLMDGQKIVDLGYYLRTTQGEMARNDFLAQMVGLFVELRIAPLYLEDADALFQNLLECFSTNLSAQEFVSRSGFFRSLFSKDDRTTVVSLGGRYYSNRTGFIINDTAVRTLRGMLGAG